MGRAEPWAEMERFPFTYDGVMREVHRTSEPSDRAIVIMHELGGLSRETIELAEYLADDFQVHLPLMFGRIGQRNRVRGMIPGALQGLCVRSEFLTMQAQRSSPISEWMRALCRFVSAERDGSPVGVIGMCLTGSMVFSMAWDPSVGAAVAAQPSLPLRGRDQLTASNADVAATRRCLAAGKRMVTLRFDEDGFSPKERLDTITAGWGDLVGVAPAADDPGEERPLTMVTYPRTVDKGMQHATLTFNADDTQDPTFERSRNRVRNFMLEELRP